MKGWLAFLLSALSPFAGAGEQYRPLRIGRPPLLDGSLDAAEWSGYWLSTNPLGARVDAQFFEEGEIWQAESNGVWDCVSRVDAEGWTSEIRIPFSTLRFHPAPENVMGINLFRRSVRTNEQLFSPLIPLNYANGTPNVSTARKYVFAGIAAGHDIRVRPYLLGRQQWLAGASPGALSDAEPAKVGLDATYGLTPSLAASATVNTDFALIELDDRQINLSRFDLFYPEKRDFFLENGGLFLFGLPREAEVFFSRRIGLAGGAGGEPAAIPIRAGGKLTGRAGPVELGLIEVRTGGQALAGPENFLVARAKHGFGRRSYAGVIASHKAVGGRFEHAALGADGTFYLLGDVGVSGFASFTRTSDPAAGPAWPAAWNVTLFKRGEQKAFRVGVTDIAKSFDPAMGFLLRSGVRKLDVDTRLPWYVQRARARRLTASYAGNHVERHSGGTESWTHSFAATLDLQSDDSLRLYGGPLFDAVAEPFTIFRHTVVPPGQYRAALLGFAFTSKPGRRLSGETTLEAAGFNGGSRRSVVSRAQWKVSRNATATLEYTSNWVRMPTTAFRAEVVQARLDVARDTRLSARVLVQYDNASQDLGLNMRLNYLFREGTELAFVYGRRDERSPGTAAPLQLARADSVALLKLTWLFNF